jgi:epoxyqueuosine reductase
MNKTDIEKFNKNPAAFLEKAVKDYIAQSPSNYLPSFPGEHIFDEPLVGFADGDDPIFHDYKRVVSDFHVTPREAMEMDLKARGCGGEKRQFPVSVISWILPSTSNIRKSLRVETVVASLMWNHMRWYGQDLNYRLARYIVSLLEGFGHNATAPELEKYYERKMLANGLASNWSQRHIAYAAGLGTFSLSDGFITAKGIAIRAGSVVCDLALPATPRTSKSHLDNCLYYREESCGVCIERCPVSAISKQGHDKKKCQDYLENGQKEVMKKLGRDDSEYLGKYLGCGLCQTKVPCEGMIPKGKKT